MALGVIGAVIALYAYNPRGFIKGVVTVYQDGSYLGISRIVLLTCSAIRTWCLALMETCYCELSQSNQTS